MYIENYRFILISVIMENNKKILLDLTTESFEQMLYFVESKNATKDIDSLIVIQTFIQKISRNSIQHLDPSTSIFIF